MGNTQYLPPDSQAGRTWEIFSSDSTTKYGGLVKYSVFARQQRREVIDILRSGSTVKEGTHGKY